MRLHPTFAALSVALLLALGLIGCQAQSVPSAYPSKPIEYVLHTPAGSASYLFVQQAIDILQKEKIVPQPLTPVVKEGGAAALAMTYLATEKKGDDHVLGALAAPWLMTPLTQKDVDVSYKDLTPIALLATDPLVLVVRSDSPYRTLKELLDAAKAKPKQLKQGGGTLTASDNPVRFQLQKMSGAEWDRVTFKSWGEALTAMLGGNVDMVIASPGTVSEQIRAGKVRALASVSDNRLASYPDLPTLKELGYSIGAESLRAVVGPKGMSASAVTYWVGALDKLSKTEAWKKFVRENDAVLDFKGGAEFGKWLDELNGRLAVTLKEMGIAK